VRLAGQGAPLHCMMVSAFQVRHPVPSLARRSHPCRRGHDGQQRQAWSVKASAKFERGHEVDGSPGREEGGWASR
jgi:hypothetical protein